LGNVSLLYASFSSFQSRRKLTGPSGLPLGE
jgi:hypothetical protein